MTRITALLVIVALVVALGWQISRARGFQVAGEIFTQVKTDAPLVALTFDDGPSNFTDEVLAILDASGVRATFFLIGKDIEANPGAARAIAEAGHEIGNHSYSHPRLVLKSPGRVRDEITRTDAAIRATGYDGEIAFRPPFGKKLIVLPLVLAEMNRAAVMWSLEPETEVTAADDLIHATVGPAKAGDIILLHPMYSSRAETRAALPAIIEGLRAKGLEPVPLGDLLAAESQ